jgi:hypothetical protein
MVLTPARVSSLNGLQSRMMEKTILVTLACLVIFYCASTEILDSTGRIEVIRKYFPAFPKFLETRTFRMLLLLATGGLLARIVTLRPGP